MADPKELQFHEAMLDIYRKAKSEAKYNAIRFMQMVTDHGGVRTAHMLINSANVSEGYTALWERKRLDLTIEAMIRKRTIPFTLHRGRARNLSKAAQSV